MSDSASPSDWTEDISSLLPALTLLQQLGYSYLTPEEALKLRGGKRSKIVLEEVLLSQLAKLNSFTYKGKTQQFTPATLSKAVEAISNFPYDALYTTAKDLYDLLTLGKSFEQIIDGDKRSFDIKYIDWEHPENNVYHVTDEFEIERRNSTALRRPDCVLFVNGIPLAVIEAKRPDLRDAIDQAISQHLRNHKAENIPHFFCLTQLLLAISQNDARYGTTSTDKEFWAIWKESDNAGLEQELNVLVNTPLDSSVQEHMLVWRQPWQQRKLREIWSSGERLVSAQDRALYSLLRPRRLLDLVNRYIVFDGGVKKVARYQQYFAVKETLGRVTQLHADKSRQGGVIWHTTGSGKSITMVLLAKALAMEKSILNPKVILVNDRIDLDDQLKDTFKNCGAAVIQAQDGRHLMQLVNLPKAEIITTVINKFEKVASEKVKNESPDIFILVDESHRSQYGSTHAKMRTVFPNACYIGFTGTPLLKKEKSTAHKFGGFIHSYSMPKAVADKAVVPILYEGRDSEFRNTEAVDKWFERITRDLTPEQKADLKRKFQSAEPLYDSESRIAEIAYDISEHFKATFKGTLFKGQLATSSKKAAITYKKLLDDMNIKAEVIISAPDTREDHDSVDESDTPEVQRFWSDMMARYGSQEKYQELLIDAFKKSDSPELLIVVDKLLTGFDAPRNTVLYIDKRLKEHSILQAIARVNRLFSNSDGSQTKDYGLVIDYRGIFGEMNEALDMYAALEREGYDLEDVEGTLINVKEEIAKLATHHASLWAVFNGVSNKREIEAMQQWLYLEDRRDSFYDALRSYARTLQLALSNATWQEETDDSSKQRYSNDLKYFLNLRTAVRQRYGEAVDFSHYEKQIRTMVLKELGAEEVKTIIEQVDIFKVDRFEEELGGVEGDAAKADVIASRIKKVITERMEEDPVLYKKLSELIEEAISNHRLKRLSDAEYLRRMREHLETAQTQGASALPEGIRNREEARAYYS
ncbi:MAG: type I restriction endonuclease subunit R [Trueperaceae bacterium]|nr:type I restriction endonuclease subunit R [Trueperaceae bacterium]